jgi:hypothetical protein
MGLTRVFLFNDTGKIYPLGYVSSTKQKSEASVRAGGLRGTLRSAGLWTTDDLYLLYISDNVAK